MFTYNEIVYMIKDVLIQNNLWLPPRAPERYLQFLLFLKTEMAEEVEIYPHARQGTVYPT